ncbi:MAG: type II toxin-antitoxin system PemK/MazF family toxin, partial [Desulfobacterales bacterium]|nr:type II toxin-antitoxin system PemK/MazF family toxin [Desulfobacterales bacterium]
QNNLFNSSNINTVVMCALTSNLKRGLSPGNIVLKKGEANLPKKSVINITQIYTVDKSDLFEKIGKVNSERLKEILSGVHLLIEPREL